MRTRWWLAYTLAVAVIASSVPLGTVLVPAPAAQAQAACPGLAEVAITGTAPDGRNKGDIADFPNKGAVCKARWVPGLDAGFVPQGIEVLGDESMLVSGYFNEAGTEAGKDDEYCGVYQVDWTGGAGVLLAKFAKDFCSHGGGIAVVGDHVFIADTPALIVVTLTDLLGLRHRKGWNESKLVGAGTAGFRQTELTGNVNGSFLTVDLNEDPDEDQLWVGTWCCKKPDNKTPSVAHAYSLEKILGTPPDGPQPPEPPAGSLGPSETTWELPQGSQGAVLLPDGTWWVSRSRASCGMMGTPGGFNAPFIPGSEEVEAVPGGRYLTLSEAGSKRWKGTFTPLIVEFDPSALESGDETCDLGDDGSAPAQGKVAFSCAGENGSLRDICVVDLDSQERTNLTKDQGLGGANQHPTWSPDGTSIIFSHSSQGVVAPLDATLYRVPADGSKPARPLGRDGQGIKGFQPNWSDGNQIFRFDATADNEKSYLWDFGDGGVGQRASVEHVYLTTPGDVTLTVTNALGLPATLTKPANPFDDAGRWSPAIGISRGPGLEVSFEPGAHSANKSSWDFGDGTRSAERDPTHVYTAPGRYTVGLQLVAEDGSVARLTATFELDAAETRLPPAAGFSVQELGSKIVYVQPHPDFKDADVGTFRAPTELAVANPDGSGVERLTNPTGFSRSLEPEWRPDRVRVAYAFSKGGGPSSSMIPRLQIASQYGKPASAESTWFNVTHDFTRAPDGTDDPTWSPDGTRIAYVKCSIPEGYGICRSGTSQIAVMDTDGSATGDRQIVITDTKDRAILRQPAWSPDGTLIAYQDTSDGILLVSPDSRKLGRVPHTVPGDAEPAWRPGVGDLSDARVLSADGAGEPRFYFTDVDDAFARIHLPSSATDRRLCIYKATPDATLLNAVLPGEESASHECTEDRELPDDFSESSPLPSTGTLPAGELVDLKSFYKDTLSPGRWFLVLRWEDDEEVHFAESRTFTITCRAENCGEASFISVGQLRVASEVMGTTCQALQMIAMAENIYDVIEVSRRTRSNATPAMFWVGLGMDLAAPIASDFITNAAWNLISPTALTFAKDKFNIESLEEMLQNEENRLMNKIIGAGFFDPVDDADVKRLERTQKARAQAAESRTKQTRRITGSKALSVFCDQVLPVLDLVIQALEGSDLNIGPSGFRMSAVRRLAAQAAPTGPYDEAVTIELGGDAVVDDNDRLAIHFDRLTVIGTALAEAINRATAAAAAGDTQWQAAHLEEASQYSAMMSATQRSLADLLTGVTSDPAEAELLSAMLFTAERAARMQQIVDRLGTTGFNEDELAHLRSMGTTDEDIVALQADGAAATVPTELIGKTMGGVLGDTISALEESADVAFDPFRGRAAVHAAEVFRGPHANSGSVEVLVDTPTPIALSADDPDGDVLTYTVVDPPAHGALSGEAPELVYTPDAGYRGPDSITFVADDGDGPSLPATVSIEVALPPPDPEPDAFGSRQGEVLAVPAPGVLLNDGSPRLPLSAKLERSTAGLTAFRPDGSFEFTAPTDVVGPVTFTYRARFAGSVASQPVTVTIDIVNREDPPQPIGDIVELPEDAVVSFAPTANDADPDGDPITLVGYGQPAHGTVACGLDFRCTYRPEADFTGTDAMEYIVDDGTGRRVAARVTFVVGPVADPARAVADRLSFDKGGPGTIDVLANDSHPDGLAFGLVANTSPANGSVLCEPTGSCTYTPIDNTIVADTFTYTVRDATGRDSTATVTVAAFAAFEEIVSDGPLLFIDTGASLSCAVEYDGDLLGSFFADFGCGTFAAVEGTLYGPERISGSGNPPQPRTTFTRRTQSDVSGTGTFDDPFLLTTGVEIGSTGLSLAQADRYVQGEESYRTDLTLTNRSDEPRSITLYRAGDCQLGDFDTGFGRIDPSTGGAACVAESGRILEWLPLGPGSSPLEAGADEVWDAIASQQPFDGTCRCVENIDNGAGLSWTLTLAPGEARTVSHLTVFSPFGYSPLTTAAVADGPVSGAGTQNGYSVTITNPNPTTPVTLREVAVTLPAGFSYVAGSTSGAITSEPITDGRELTWAGPLHVPADGSVTIDLAVVTALATGTHFVEVRGQASPFAVTPTGPTAPIEVISNQDPLAAFANAVDSSEVEFDGSSSTDPDGTVVEWSWRFGDGEQGAGTSVTHTYAEPGAYEVTLTVTDDVGAIAERTEVVTILRPNEPPDAVATAAPLRDAPRTSEFNGLASTDLDGTVVGWRWDFGDGTAGSGAGPAHTFAADGDFDVTLTVTDDRGATDTSVVRVVVRTPNAPPIAAFVAPVSGLLASFDASSSSDSDGPGGRPVSYSWTFGDGTSGEGVAPQHVYVTTGTYEVTLRVTDAAGSEDSTTRLVGVGDEANVPPVAAAAVDSPDGFTVQFDGSNSVDTDGTIVAYEWNLGDDALALGPTPTHTYASTGTYTVELVVTDEDGATDVVSRELTLTEEPPPTSTTTTTTTTVPPDTTTTTTTTVPPDTTTTTTTTVPPDTTTTTTTTVPPDTTTTTTTTTTVPPDTTTTTTTTVPPDTTTTTTTTVPPDTTTTTTTTVPPDTTTTTTTTVPPDTTTTTTTDVRSIPEATLLAEPSIIRPGEAVTYTARGFEPGTAVTFQYNPVLGTATADQSGTATIVAAGMSHPGVYTVTASSADGRRATARVTVVNLTAAPTGPSPTPPPPSPTPPPPTPIVGILPTTGGGTTDGLRLSMGVLLAGLLAVLVARRRRRDLPTNA